MQTDSYRLFSPPILPYKSSEQLLKGQVINYVKINDKCVTHAELGNFLRKLFLGKGCIIYLNKHKNENVGSGVTEGPISY